MKIKTQKTVFLTKEETQTIKETIRILNDLSEELDLLPGDIIVDLNDTNFKFIYPQDVYNDEDACPVIVTK